MRKEMKLTRKFTLPTAAAVVCCQLLLPICVEAKVYTTPITGVESNDSNSGSGQYEVDSSTPGILTYKFEQGDKIYVEQDKSTEPQLPNARSYISGVILPSSINLYLNPTGSRLEINVNAVGGRGVDAATAIADVGALGISGAGTGRFTLGSNTMLIVRGKGGTAESITGGLAQASAHVQAIESSGGFTLEDNIEILALAEGGNAFTPTNQANANAESYGIKLGNGSSTIGNQITIKSIARGGKSVISDSSAAAGYAYAGAIATGIANSDSISLGDNVALDVLAEGGRISLLSPTPDVAYAMAAAYGMRLDNNHNSSIATGDLSIKARAVGGEIQAGGVNFSLGASAGAAAYGIYAELDTQMDILGNLYIYTEALAGRINGIADTVETYVLFADNARININTLGGKNVKLTGDINAFNNGSVKLVLDTPDSYWRPSGNRGLFGTGSLNISGGAVLDLAYLYGTSYQASKARYFTVDAGQISIGDGAVFRINSDFEQGVADKIVFNPGAVISATGTQYIQVAYDPYLEKINRAGTIQLYVANPIQVLDLGAGFSTNMVAGQNSKLDNALYRFELSPIISYDELTGTASIAALEVSAESMGLSESSLTVSDAQRAMRNLWQIEGNSLLRRMGDLRLNGAQNGGWVRQYGGEIKAKSAYERNIRQKYYGLQVGYDKEFALTKGRNYLGFFGQNISSSPGYEQGSGKAKSSGAGIYSSWLWDKGHYVDLVVRASRLKNKYDLIDFSGNAAKADYDTWAYGVSAEYGYRADLKNNWFYQPQAELTLGRINSAGYQTSNGLNVKQGSVNSALARLGVLIGQEFKGKITGNYYLKGSLLRDFGSAGTLKASYLNNTENLATGKNMGSAFELNLGTNIAFRQNSSFYFELTKSMGGKIRTDWQVNGGFRFCW